MNVDGPTRLFDDGMDCYGSDRIIACCELAGADVYVAGRPSLEAYLENDQFASRGIRLEAQNWAPPEYEQPSATVEKNLSVLDLILSVGGKQARKLLEAT